MSSSFDSEHTLSPRGAKAALPPTPEGGRPPWEAGEQGRQRPSLPNPGDPRSFCQRRRERTLPQKPKNLPPEAECTAAATRGGRERPRDGPRTHSDVHTWRGHAAAVVEVILDGEARVAGIRVGHKGNRSLSFRCRTKTAREMPTVPSSLPGEVVRPERVVPRSRCEAGTSRWAQLEN